MEQDAARPGCHSAGTPTPGGWNEGMVGGERSPECGFSPRRRTHYAPGLALCLERRFGSWRDTQFARGLFAGMRNLGTCYVGDKGRETVGNAVRPAADSQATGQATTASQWQSSDPAPGPTVAPVAMLRTSPIQLTAGMRKRPGRRRRSNRRCKERAKRASRSAGGYEGAVGCLAWFLFLSATSWTMVRITWCAASRRTPEERSSTPVPHHAAGGRLSSLEPTPGERGSIPGERSGSGTDPPAFWRERLEKP